ncbi:MAG: thioesterase domain-containing protein, partial [Cyanobacteria bacterium J06559_1]
LKTAAAQSSLILVHDADGDTGLYIHLAHQLSGDRTVYGIRPLAQPGVPMVHSRIPDMAAHYIAELRHQQPHGPYLLGGLCAGGVLAAEMALQLEAAGETVALTALLEAPDVAAEERVSLSQQRLSRLSDQLASLSLAQRLTTVATKAVNVVRYEASQRFLQAKRVLQIRALRLWQDQQPANNKPAPGFAKGLSVRSLYLFAEGSYSPKAQLQGRVVLIKATKGSGEPGDQAYCECYQDDDFGWRNRLARPLEIHQVVGGHFTMLRPDYAAAIARILDQSIETALTT